MNIKPIIEFRDFSFQYFTQSEPTLRGITLQIFPGEKVLIAGPSGSGKSTLGHCINGLIPFYYKGESRGTLTVNGVETKQQNIFRLSKVVGTVLQDTDCQFVGLTAGEDIAFSMENDRVALPEMKERVLKAAQMLDMDRWLTLSPFELSGGQKQRTALAGVMVDDVDVLLFDEPLANLDPATGKQAIEIIHDICRDRTKTVIIIEHRLEDVLHREVDRVILIDDGQIAADMDAHSLVASDVLKTHGIREPLYVTALKYAGVRVTPASRAGYMQTLRLSAAEKQQVVDWHNAVQPPPPPPEKPPVLRVEHVDFSYDAGKQVLSDVSFVIREGEMLSLVGRNGAGKSTIAKLMCGFERPDRGRILCGGEDIAKKSIKEIAEQIGYVMQNPNQMISQTLIRDEVALGLKLRGTDKDETEDRVQNALSICGLRPFRKWPVASLSYGQKKRVTIAAILALDPKIIILDEPTAGQDYRHYSEIMDFLRAINERGITVLMITHDMHLMQEYTPRVIALSDGQVIADRSAAAILTDADVIGQANLKETSLYALAQLAGIPDGTAFVQRFIDEERRRGL